MIGGIIGAAIVVLAVALLALCLMRRRRRNQDIRAFIVASPDPFPHTAIPSPQAASPSPPPGVRRMAIQTVAPTSMSRATFSDLGLPNMTENTIDRAPSTVTRKKPVPFLNDLDLGTEDRLSVRSVSPSAMNLSPVAEDPFADPARNPFEDPRPGVPAVVVHPATPRHSTISTLSDSKVCRFFCLPIPRSAID